MRDVIGKRLRKSSSEIRDHLCLEETLVHGMLDWSGKQLVTLDCSRGYLNVRQRLA